MAYKVQFVGLCCFLREASAVRALMPDGRYPAGTESPHIATVAIEPESLAFHGGWFKNEITGDKFATEFRFPPSDIVLEGAINPGHLDYTRQQSRLPPLRSKVKPVQIDPALANAIADIPIVRGTLEAFRFPGSDDNGKAPLISELIVPHTGQITITFTPRDGSRVRTVTVAAGAEIVFVNSSRRTVGVGDNHYNLYSELVVGRPRLDDPPSTPLKLPLSTSKHKIFRRGKPIGGSARCSNTGCCG